MASSKKVDQMSSDIKYDIDHMSEMTTYDAATISAEFSVVAYSETGHGFTTGDANIPCWLTRRARVNMTIY